MRGLIQRVSEARVVVDGEITGEIGRGILLLLGVERDDTPDHVQRLLHKVLHYRIFPDADGKMNLNVAEVAGGLLVVSQFTLAADADQRRGGRKTIDERHERVGQYWPAPGSAPRRSPTHTPAGAVLGRPDAPTRGRRNTPCR